LETPTAGDELDRRAVEALLREEARRRGERAGADICGLGVCPGYHAVWSYLPHGKTGARALVSAAGSARKRKAAAGRRGGSLPKLRDLEEVGPREEDARRKRARRY
jgi:hypothetical protein